MATYAVSCDSCKSTVTVRCQCDPAADTHEGGCAAADFDAAVRCAPDAGCCGQDHHHGQATTETGDACRPVTITVLDLGTPVRLGG